jgi:hypothetical protein
VGVGNIESVDSHDTVTPLRIVEQLCKFFCDLVGWRLPGKSVLLRIDDTDDPALLSTVVKGIINDVVAGAFRLWAQRVLTGRMIFVQLFD